MVDNPALWRLSMMIGEGGIDVLCRRELGEPETLTGRLTFDASAESSPRAVEDLVYANPLLLQPFRKVDIVMSGGFTLTVPFGTDTSDVDALFPSDDPTVTLSAPIDARNEILFRVERGVNNFLRRTFDSVRPVHALSVLGQYFETRSRLGNSAKMFVDIEDEIMNVLVFNHLGLAMASNFKYRNINDATYYALASANTAGLDFTNDEIKIAGNSDKRAEIMPILRQFARNVMPAIFPSVAAVGDSAAMSAPFPLVIMPLCE